MIALIAAGGWVAVVIILLICLIALIVGSCFGLFFGSDSTGTGTSVTQAVSALNGEYLAHIQEIEDANPHDRMETTSNDGVLAFPDTNASTFSLQQKIDQLQQEMAALVKIMAQGGDSQFYAAKLRELSEQKVKLARQLQESQQQQQEGKIRAYQEQQALIVLSNEDSLDLTEFHEDFIRRVIEQVTVLSKDRILVRFVGGFEVEGKIPQGN